MSTVIAIIQARMSSSRLPGKVLLDIAGQPMLVNVAERARQARAITQVVVATTTDPADDPIEQLCLQRGYPCYRGSLPDVLDRYYQAACLFQADVIVRLTADCPLLDPAVVDLTVKAFFHQPVSGEQFPTVGEASSASEHIDFAANRLPPPWSRSLPIGMDTEVCSFAALERAWKEADQTHHREHVMPYLYEGITFGESPSHLVNDARNVPPSWYVTHGLTPRGFRIAQLHHSPDYGALRWTVDTPADLELVRQIFSRFGGQMFFSWLDVLSLLEREPELSAINADVQHKTAFDVDQRTNHSALR